MNIDIITEVANELLHHTNPNAFMQHFASAHASKQEDSITFWLLVEHQLHEQIEVTDSFTLDIELSSLQKDVQALRLQYETLCGHLEQSIAKKAAHIAARCNIKARRALESIEM